MRDLYLLYGASRDARIDWATRSGVRSHMLGVSGFAKFISSPSHAADGSERTSRRQINNAKALLSDAVAMRLEEGELTVILLGTRSEEEIIEWLELVSERSLRARVHLVNFTRYEMDKRVAKFAEAHGKDADDLHPFDQMTPDEATEHIRRIGEIDADEEGFSYLDVIGDVHGCADPLLELLAGIGAISAEARFADDPSDISVSEDHLVVFVGDYADRGPENARTIRLLDALSAQDNVVVLEGNHEKWIANWLAGDPRLARGFRETTQTELDADAEAMEGPCRRLISRLQECAIVRFGNRRVVCCHGGISSLPEFQRTLSTGEFIRGFGRRDETWRVHSAWDRFSDPRDVEHGGRMFAGKYGGDWRMRGAYMVHGHRGEALREGANVSRFGRAICLENGVERGGTLMACQFTLDEHMHCQPPEIYEVDGCE